MLTGNTCLKQLSATIFYVNHRTKFSGLRCFIYWLWTCLWHSRTCGFPVIEANQVRNSVVEIMFVRRLKPTESRELPTKKVTENPILTDHFIIFYRSYEDWLIIFSFFKELHIFLLLLIPILYFMSLFIKEWTQWPVFFLFLLLPFIFRVSSYKGILLLLLF